MTASKILLFVKAGDGHHVLRTSICRPIYAKLNTPALRVLPGVFLGEMFPDPFTVLIAQTWHKHGYRRSRSIKNDFEIDSSHVCGMTGYSTPGCSWVGSLSIHERMTDASVCRAR